MESFILVIHAISVNKLVIKFYNLFHYGHLFNQMNIKLVIRTLGNLVFFFTKTKIKQFS